MKVYQIKAVGLELGLTVELIIEILMGLDVITGSWAIINSKGLVVELEEQDDEESLVTTLLLTESCVALMEEIATARSREDLISKGRMPHV